jgi:hypothetical protein
MGMIDPDTRRAILKLSSSAILTSDLSVTIFQMDLLTADSFCDEMIDFSQIARDSLTSVSIFLFLGIVRFCTGSKKSVQKRRSVGCDDEIGCMAQHSRYLGEKRKRTQNSLYGTTQAVFWNILPNGL